MKAQTAVNHEKLLSVAEAAERLNLKPVTIRSWVSRRRIAWVRVGERTIRIPASELARILERGYVPRTAPGRDEGANAV